MVDVFPYTYQMVGRWTWEHSSLVDDSNTIGVTATGLVASRNSIYLVYGNLFVHSSLSTGVHSGARWMFSAASVCLFVSLSVSSHDNFRMTKRTMIKLGG